MRTKKILKTIEDTSGGASITKKGLKYNPDHGYFISITDNEIKRPSADLIKKIDKKAQELGIKKYFFGYWEDKKTGKQFLDLSIWESSKRQALKLAEKYNQKAIFGCQELESIYV